MVSKKSYKHQSYQFPVNMTQKKFREFRVRSLYKIKKPRALHIAKQKFSFMIATLSIVAFVAGNMVGQHGWYAFWKTVLGAEDDRAIAFVGTVPPISKIPDYALWAEYGGSKSLHTYNQVPSHVLRDLPSYDQSVLTQGDAGLASQAYSTLWNGGYSSPHGSHPGVDIDAPRGTPVLAIANGVIEMKRLQGHGFGNHVLIRHPNVPDPANPGKTMTLYSTYAHMDTVLVEEGQVVHKGQKIGTVGNTGLTFGATGYHLYFQVEKQDTPFHPYWPFTSSEISDDGMSFYQAVNSTAYQSRIREYTLNPMEFVQQYRTYTGPVIAQSASTTGVTSQVSIVELSPADRLRASVTARKQERLVRSGNTRTVVTKPETIVNASSSSTSSSASSVQTVAQAEQSEFSTETPSITGSNTDVHHLTIEHSGTITRTWQKVSIIAVDARGERVRSPSFSGRLYVIPEFGDAEIRPSELSPLDFVNGVATVNILIRSNKTLFISTRGAFSAISEPFVYER